jgi:hypothetical protein
MIAGTRKRFYEPVMDNYDSSQAHFLAKQGVDGPVKPGHDGTDI